jgi:hypothetical protein
VQYGGNVNAGVERFGQQMLAVEDDHAGLGAPRGASHTAHQLVLATGQAQRGDGHGVLC